MSLVLKKSNPTKRITAEDYHVSANISEFSEKHLDITKERFNPETNPEFFDFGNMGIDYSHTERGEVISLTEAQKKLYQQFFRPGKNKAWAKILKSVLEMGYDLRCKGIFVIIDSKGKILYVFGGNTINEVLKKTNIQNRIIHYFTLNKNFSITNLIAVGTRMNSLEKQSGGNDDNTIAHVLQQLVEYGGADWILPKNATHAECKTFSEKVKKYVAYMLACKKEELPEKKLNVRIVEMIQGQLEHKTILSIDSYKAVLTYLEEEEGYTNNKLCNFGAYGAFGSKIFTHFALKNKDFKDRPKTDPDYFDYKNGQYNLVIHMGTPDPSNPVSDFWTKYTKFYEEFKLTHDFLDNDYYLKNPYGIGNYKVIGAFQQVRELEHIWPFGSIVPFDELMQYYRENVCPQPINLLTLNNDEDDEEMEEILKKVA